MPEMASQRYGWSFQTKSRNEKADVHGLGRLLLYHFGWDSSKLWQESRGKLSVVFGFRRWKLTLPQSSDTLWQIPGIIAKAHFIADTGGFFLWMSFKFENTDLRQIIKSSFSKKPKKATFKIIQNLLRRQTQKRDGHVPPDHSRINQAVAYQSLTLCQMRMTRERRTTGTASCSLPRLFPSLDAIVVPTGRGRRADGKDRSGKAQVFSWARLLVLAEHFGQGLASRRGFCLLPVHHDQHIIHQSEKPARQCFWTSFCTQSQGPGFHFVQMILRNREPIPCTMPSCVRGRQGRCLSTAGMKLKETPELLGVGDGVNYVAEALLQWCPWPRFCCGGTWCISVVLAFVFSKVLDCGV